MTRPPLWKNGFDILSRRSPIRLRWLQWVSVGFSAGCIVRSRAISALRGESQRHSRLQLPSAMHDFDAPAVNPLSTSKLMTRPERFPGCRIVRQHGSCGPGDIIMEIDRPASTIVDAQAAVSWPAIAAGAVAAAALALVLISFGAGLGLSAISPWSDSGISASDFQNRQRNLFGDRGSDVVRSRRISRGSTEDKMGGDKHS